MRGHVDAPGRMRERDQVDVVASKAHLYARTDHVDERSCRQELLDREPADRHDQTRPQQRDLTLQPWATVRDLVGVRYAVAALGPFARKQRQTAAM